MGPDELVVAVDAEDGFVKTKGWQERSDVRALDLVRRLEEMGVREILYTDISRDGMMQSVNLDGIRELAEGSGLEIIASGGVTSLDDLRALKTLESLGVTGVIAGRALYEGPLHRSGEALAVLRLRRGSAGRRRRGGLMLLKRIIPCLDVDQGRVVKGTNFVDIRDAGDPVELAARYDQEGADELVFLDITASHEKRDTIVDLARRCAEELFIPFTIGGGIRSEEDVRALLGAGADKVSLNSAAIHDPDLIASVRPALRLAVRRGGHRRQARDRGAVRAEQRAGRCAGRSTSTAAAYPPAWTRWNGRSGRWRWAPARSCSPPWTGTAPRTATTWSSPGPSPRRSTCRSSPAAARGRSTIWSRSSARAGADAVLAASIFHYGEYTIREAKEYMAAQGIPVRL